MNRHRKAKKRKCDDIEIPLGEKIIPNFKMNFQSILSALKVCKRECDN